MALEVCRTKTLHQESHFLRLERAHGGGAFAESSTLPEEVGPGPLKDISSSKKGRRKKDPVARRPRPLSWTRHAIAAAVSPASGSRGRRRPLI